MDAANAKEADEAGKKAALAAKEKEEAEERHFKEMNNHVDGDTWTAMMPESAMNRKNGGLGYANAQVHSIKK